MAGFKPSQPTLINSHKQLARMNFKIFDSKGWEQTLSLQSFLGNNGSRRLYIYSQAYIINESYIDLLYFTNFDKRRQPIPGQKYLQVFFLFFFIIITYN